MAERRENSVLFSLRELRQIEDDRQKEELDQERARLDAEQKAKAETERKAREDDERKKREEEERVLRMQQEKERQIREEQLRLQESERRAHIEAAAKLEEARIHAEAHAAAVAKKLPIGAIVAVVGLLLAGVGGTAFYFVKQSDDRAKAVAEQAQADIERIKKMNEQSMTSLQALLNQTQDAAKRAEIEKQMALEKANNEAKLKALEEKVVKVRPASTGKKVERKTGGGSGGGKPCDPNDPLCGSGDLH